MQSHYPNFNVMAEKEHWDEHTRTIVEQRMDAPKYQTLKPDEVETLHHLCSVLVDDERTTIIDYVVSHFDNKLTATLGESQREKGLPKFGQLVWLGIQVLNQCANQVHNKPFGQLSHSQQLNLIDQLIQDNPELDMKGVKIRPKDFLSRIHTEAVSAYYSHPDVWSEIGYAGPAYPRGYVRSERGLTDPWEAKQQDA